MAVVYNDTMIAVLSRLTGSPTIVSNGNVRRGHRTVVPRDECPAVHLVDGTDKPQPSKSDCRQTRDGEFAVRVIVRGDEDATIASAWEIAQDVMDRLNPLNAGAAYPIGATIEPREIRPDQEIADSDVYALDMYFNVRYAAAYFSLEPAT
jgi:hypothetical protein